MPYGVEQLIKKLTIERQTRFHFKAKISYKYGQSQNLAHARCFPGNPNAIAHDQWLLDGLWAAVSFLFLATELCFQIITAENRQTSLHGKH